MPTSPLSLCPPPPFPPHPPSPPPAKKKIEELITQISNKRHIKE